MAKLHKIKSLKSIKDVIERNHKSKDLIELYQNNAVLVTVRFFLFFSLKRLLMNYFSGASMLHFSTKFDKTCTKMIV